MTTAAIAIAAFMLLSGDPHLPDFGPALDIVPAEETGEVHLKMIIERERVVVHGEGQTVARLERVQHPEDARVSLSAGNGADVEVEPVCGDIGHGVSL